MDFLLKLKCSTQAACLYKNGSLEKGRDIRKHNLFVAVLLPMLYLLFLILLELGVFTFLEKMRIRMHALLVGAQTAAFSHSYALETELIT